ncbi:MAG: hypothetical protein KDK99_09545 [Verrucomicrobiales bacterium]|nr:hypothetical protein [Verrucomicrobiales bacterium]
MPTFPAHRLDRRRFLQLATSAAAWVARSADAAPPNTLPRLLYSNDTTNITSCTSPWRKSKGGISDESLRATIREAAGVDVHLLQPGLGWIPWWDSEVYSPKQHYGEFLPAHGIQKLNSFGKYLLQGGDLVRTLTDECAKEAILPFVSYRLNDGHHTRGLKESLKTGIPDQGMSRHYWENLDRYRIGKDPSNWDEAVFDWSIPAVRDHKAALITELCETHDFAGLELDFLRHWVRFSTERTPAEVRADLTTEFVKKIRAALDLKTWQGRKRWLGVRVPACLDLHADQGVDLVRWVKEAGIDFINLSHSYFTIQDDAVAQVRALLPDIPVYVEMTHTTLTGKALAGSGTQPYLRTTDAQFYTTAHLAYQQGATGVSLFNFAYYREHSHPGIGPFHEPPFHVLPHLKDREFVARQPHWYFLTAGRKDPVLGAMPLPVELQPGKPHTFHLRTAPTSAHTRDGLLRFRATEPIADRAFEVSLNGQPLATTPFVAKPIDHPYDAWLGEANEHTCFTVPRSTVKTGINDIEILLKTGTPAPLIYLDLTLPVR